MLFWLDSCKHFNIACDLRVATTKHSTGSYGSAEKVANQTKTENHRAHYTACLREAAACDDQCSNPRLQLKREKGRLGLTIFSSEKRHAHDTDFVRAVASTDTQLIAGPRQRMPYDGDFAIKL